MSLAFGVVVDCLRQQLLAGTALTLNQAAAATFLFRGTIYLAPALYGLLSYLFLWIPMVTPDREESTLFRNQPSTQNSRALGLVSYTRN